MTEARLYLKFSTILKMLNKDIFTMILLHEYMWYCIGERVHYSARNADITGGYEWGRKMHRGELGETKAGNGGAWWRYWEYQSKASADQNENNHGGIGVLLVRLEQLHFIIHCCDFCTSCI